MPRLACCARADQGQSEGLFLTAYERSELTVEAVVSAAVLEPAGDKPAATETYGTMGADSREASRRLTLAAVEKTSTCQPAPSGL